MANENDIGGRVSLDTTDFKANIAALNRQIQIIDTGFRAAAAGMDDWGSSQEGLEQRITALNSITDLQRQKVANLQAQYEAVAAEQGENSRAAQALQVQINQQTEALNRNLRELGTVTQSLDNMRNGSDDAADSTDELGNSAEEAGGKLKEMAGDLSKKVAIGIAAIGVAAAAAVVSLVKMGDDSNKAMNHLQTQTGATAAEMEGFRDVAQAIYADNFGEDIDDIANSMAAVNQVTKLTGDELKGATENALLMRDVFGVEVADSIKTVNTLMNNFGISADEAYTLIAQGTQMGANASGDLLDVMNEFAPHFAQLGLDANEFTDTLIQGASSGAFEIATVGDAVKEFGIITREGTDDARAALGDMGLDATKLFETFAAGGPDSAAAFNEVVTRLGEMKDPIAQNTAGVALFGSMWEDLGSEAIKALADIDDSADMAGDTLKQLNDVQYNDIGSALEGIKRTLISKVAMPVSSNIMPAINGLMGMIKNIDFSPIVSGLQWIVDKAIKVATSLVNVAVSIGNIFGSTAASYSTASKQMTSDEKSGTQARIAELQKEKSARIAALGSAAKAKQDYVAASGAASTEELDNERDALNEQKEMYSERKDAAMEQLDAELEAEKEKFDAYKETSKAAVDLRKEQLDAAVDAISEEMKALDAAEKEKLAALDAEYLARLKIVDADAAAAIESLNAQKAGIESADLAAKAAEKARKEQEKIADLQGKIAAADTTESRTAAETELANYLKELDTARQEEARKQQIKTLEDQIKGVEDTRKAQEAAIKADIQSKQEAVKTDADNKKQSLEDDKALLQETFEAFKESEDKKTAEKQKAFDSYKKMYDNDKKALEDNFKAQSKAIDDQIKAIDKAKEAASGGGGGGSGGGGSAPAIDLQSDIDSQIAAINAEYDGMINNIKEGASEAKEPLDDMMSGAIEGNKWILDNWSYVAAGLAGIAAAMITMKAVQAVTGIVNAYKLFKAATEGATVAQWLMNAAMAANPIGIVVVAVAGLIAALVVLWNTNEGFRNAMVSAWEAVKNAFIAVWDWVKGNWDTLLLMLTNPIAGALKLLYDLNPQFKAWVDGVWESIVNTFKQLPGKMSEFFTGAWNAMKKWGTDAISWVTTEVPKIIASIFNFFSGLPGKIGYALGFALGTLIQWGADALKWIIAEVPKLIAKIGGFFSELPGNLAESFGKAIGAIKTWGINVGTWIVTDVPKLISSIVGFFTGLAGKLGTELAKAFTEFAGWGSDLISTAETEIPKVIKTIVDFFAELPGDMLDIGENIVKGLWDGIKNMTGWIKDKISEFAGGIVDGMKDALGIHSPSRVMRDQVGMMVGAGMAEGIADSARQVNAAMQGLSGSVTEAFPAVAASSGAAGASETTNTISFADMFRGANFTVRSDNDLTVLGQLLGGQVTDAIRGAGV